jgi:hypothetical protein
VPRASVFSSETPNVRHKTVAKDVSVFQQGNFHMCCYRRLLKHLAPAAREARVRALSASFATSLYRSM